MAPSKKAAPKAKKTTTRRSTGTKAKTAAKKTTRKKVVTASKAKKKTTKKATTIRKTVKNARVAKPAPKTSWWSIFTALVLAGGIVGAAILSLTPENLQRLQANLFAAVEQQVLPTAEAPGIETGTSVNTGPGVLLTWENGGKNEEKLKNIFSTVFPEIPLQEVPVSSNVGKALIDELKLTEAPTVLFKEDAYQKAELSSVTDDLFVSDKGFKKLMAHLVSPTGQHYFAGPLNETGGHSIGEANAPITVYWYSEPKCQHCRASEKNHLDDFIELVDEGLIRMVFLDLPQSSESIYHAAALACVSEFRPGKYLELRQNLYTRPNLTRAYTDRQVEDLGVNTETDCDMNALRDDLRLRLKSVDAEGITGVPAAYIGATGGENAYRITGAKEFSEYQAVIDAMLGTPSAEEGEEEAPAEEESAEQAPASGPRSR